MLYLTSRSFILRRGLYAAILIGLFFLLCLSLDLSALTLVLVVAAGVTTPIRVSRELVRPTVQIELMPNANLVRLRHVGLLGGWRHREIPLDAITTVGDPTEFGSLTARQLGFPNLGRPAMRLVGLYEVHVSTADETYAIAGTREDLVESAALRALRPGARF